MKLQIIKDGSIQGWFVSLTITMVTMSAFIVSLFSDKVCDRFVRLGSTWATIVITQFTAWLAYRAYHGRMGNGQVQVPPPPTP